MSIRQWFFVLVLEYPCFSHFSVFHALIHLVLLTSSINKPFLSWSGCVQTVVGTPLASTVSSISSPNTLQVIIKPAMRRNCCAGTENTWNRPWQLVENHCIKAGKALQCARQGYTRTRVGNHPCDQNQKWYFIFVCVCVFMCVCMCVYIYIKDTANTQSAVGQFIIGNLADVL